MPEQADHADGRCRHGTKRRNGKRKRPNGSVVRTVTLGSDTLSAPYAFVTMLTARKARLRVRASSRQPICSCKR
jgi:hypothetical protein